MAPKKPTLLDKILAPLITTLLIAAVGLIWGGASSNFAKSSEVKDHEKRLITLEVNQINISNDIKEIKDGIRALLNKRK